MPEAAPGPSINTAAAEALSPAVFIADAGDDGRCGEDGDAGAVGGLT